jgi:hypothetical protein
MILGVACLQGGGPAAVVYPLENPTPYVSGTWSQIALFGNEDR